MNTIMLNMQRLNTMDHAWKSQAQAIQAIILIFVVDWLFLLSIGLVK